MNVPYRWIDCTSWELDFFGLPHLIPWPEDVDAAVANQDPFEIDHLLRAIEGMGAEAGQPWRDFSLAAVHFEELGDALEDGEVVRARELLAEVERLHPGTAFVQFHQGLVARQEGREEDAIRLYRAAAEKTPRIAAIWNNLGVMLTIRGEKDEAIVAFRRALELSPNDPMALEGLAQLRVIVKLVPQTQGGEQRPPMYVDVPKFRQMTREQAGQLAARPDELLAFAEQLLRDGIVPDVGLSALEQASSLRPEHPRTLLALTAAYRQAGELAKARATITRLTTLQPQNPEAFFHLAQVCNAAGDEAGEHQALDRVLELDPNSHNGIGIRFRVSAGEHDPAKEQQLVTFAEERGSWMAYLLAGSLARARGDARGGIRWAERALALAPENEEVIIQLAGALAEAREVARVAQMVKPKVESGKFSKRLDWAYAHVLRQLGLHRDAINVLRHAATGEAADDFKHAVTQTVDAWSGLLTGCGVRLEVHSSGFLERPILLTLEDGDGGILVNAGSPLPAEGRLPWRADGADTTVQLQQGHSGSGKEPLRLGAFRIRGIQPDPASPPIIDCHIIAQPDGALHFRASQNGRKLAVGWVPHAGVPT